MPIAQGIFDVGFFISLIDCIVESRFDQVLFEVG